MPSIELRRQTTTGETMVATPKVTDITLGASSHLTVNTGLSTIGQQVSSSLLTFAILWDAGEDKTNLENQYPILTRLTGAKWKVIGANGPNLTLVEKK